MKKVSKKSIQDFKSIKALTLTKSDQSKVRGGGSGGTVDFVSEDVIII